MKQTEKASKAELASVADYRAELAMEVKRLQNQAAKSAAWLEKTEPKLNELIKARKYGAAADLLGRAPEVVQMALDLQGDIEGYLLDANDESELEEPRKLCPTCGK
jgi:hypothetical protein